MNLVELMYPLAEIPVHEALPAFGLAKVCRINSWAPSLNPYTWRFNDIERDRVTPRNSVRFQNEVDKDPPMDVEKMTPLMKTIRRWLIKKQYEVRE